MRKNNEKTIGELWEYLTSSDVPFIDGMSVVEGDSYFDDTNGIIYLMCEGKPCCITIDQLGEY